MRFVLVLLLLLLPTLSYGISEKEYSQLIATSPEFKKAEAELNALWKVIRARVPESSKKDLLDEQRYFAKEGRDKIAANCGKASKAERYTVATMSRILELKAYLSYLDEGSATIQGLIIALHDAAGGGYGVCKGVKLRGIDHPTCFHIGYFFELENTPDLNKALQDADEGGYAVSVRGELTSPSYFDYKTVSLNRVKSSASSVTYDYENIVWRFAEKHEAGDIEPSEFCYIVLHNDVMIVRAESPADPPSIEIYKIQKKDENGFTAKQIECYTREDVEYTKTECTNTNLSGTFVNNKLYINQWPPLDKTNLKVLSVFSEGFAQRYLR